MDDSQAYYELGQEHPYDADEGKADAPKGDWSVRAARGVVKDLCDRRDVKRGFEQVDLLVRREMIASLAAIIRLAHSLPDA